MVPFKLLENVRALELGFLNTTEDVSYEVRREQKMRDESYREKVIGSFSPILSIVYQLVCNKEFRRP